MASKLATVLVVKYRGGYLELVSGDATYGRREALVAIDVGNVNQATTIGNQILALLATDSARFQVEVVGTTAAPTTRPGFGFNVLDYVSIPNADLQASAFQRVTGLTLSIDSNGVPSWVPEAGVSGQDSEEAIQRAIRRMLIGSLGGTVDAFAPTAIRTSTPIKHDPAIQPMIFNYPGPLVAGTSARWYVRRNAVATKITYSLVTAGTTTTTVLVLKNGSTWQTLSGLTSGVNKVDLVLATLQLLKDDYIQVQITTAGNSAADLTVQIDIADESSPPTE